MQGPPKPYNPIGAPMVEGQRDEDNPPSNVVPIRPADGVRADDEDAAYAELIAFIQAEKDVDTDVSFLPAATFAEGR